MEHFLMRVNEVGSKYLNLNQDFKIVVRILWQCHSDCRRYDRPNRRLREKEHEPNVIRVEAYFDNLSLNRCIPTSMKRTTWRDILLDPQFYSVPSQNIIRSHYVLVTNRAKSITSDTLVNIYISPRFF